MNAAGSVGSSGQTSVWWEAAGERLSEGRHTCNQIQTPNASSGATSCCPCCDTPSLSSVCVILRNGPCNYFSSQKFTLERLFLKELWRLMQSSSLFPAISSPPKTSPACSVKVFVFSISLAQTLWRVAQLSAGVQLGIGCLGTTSTEIREKSSNDLRGISGDKSGQLEEMWFMRSSLIWEWSEQEL